MNRPLANISNNLYGQPMFGLMQKANELQKQKRIIHFEIGDPGFDTPRNVIEATCDALYKGKTHYAESKGLPDCCKAVCQYVKKYYSFYPSEKQVVINMANASIEFICRLVADPGEEVIIPDPCFSTYYSSIVANGIVPVSVPLLRKNHYNMIAEEIEKKITDKTKLIILNSAQNPTGSLMSKAEVEKVYRLAAKYGIYILSDEVYSRIVYEGEYYSVSQYDKCKEHVILLGSLSKTYAMTGWRLGYVVCPEKLAEKMALMVETVISCIPTFLQYGMIEALTGEQNIVDERLEILRERRDRLVNGLNSISGISCELPRAAFYAFPDIREVMEDDVAFCERLLSEAGICAVPGRFFGNAGKGHVRMCYASTTLEDIEYSLKKIGDFVINLEG